MTVQSMGPLLETVITVIDINTGMAAPPDHGQVPPALQAHFPQAQAGS